MQLYYNEQRIFKKRGKIQPEKRKKKKKTIESIPAGQRRLSLESLFDFISEIQTWEALPVEKHLQPIEINI